MATNILNDARARAAKPQVRASKDPNHPDDTLAPRLTKLMDGGGLMLWIKPDGSKYWRMAYRFNGKPKSLSFGVYPEVGLGEARERRDGARRLLRDGIDPGAHKRDLKAVARAQAVNTFSALSKELLNIKRTEGRAATTMEKLEWLLGLLPPSFCERPIAEIEAPEILTVLRQIERRGKYNTVHRLRALISETFSMAIATGRAKGDPSHALRKALVTPKAQRRPAIVEAEPFGQLLRAIDGIEGGAPETRLALQLLSLTFVRPGELRHAEWSEFDLDGEQPTWTIPAAKMKMKREHKVPLSTQAVAIVRELRMLSRGGNYLFPGGRTITRPMSENAMNGVLRRLGYSKDEMCPHGLRSVASTLLNESGLWHRDAIERSLAHIDSDVVRQSYARGEYWDERVKMMQHWADHCDELRANAGVARAA